MTTAIQFAPTKTLEIFESVFGEDVIDESIAEFWDSIVGVYATILHA